jgi:hypothetical protein
LLPAEATTAMFFTADGAFSASNAPAHSNAAIRSPWADRFAFIGLSHSTTILV